MPSIVGDGNAGELRSWRDQELVALAEPGGFVPATTHTATAWEWLRRLGCAPVACLPAADRRKLPCVTNELEFVATTHTGPSGL